MSAVIDASVIVATVADSGPVGRWAEAQLSGAGVLVAPHLLPVEVANVLRRAELAGELSTDAASLALVDALDIPIELTPFEPFASRVWELRLSVTAYDAWYVAVAESTGSRLITLDRRLAAAPGPLCEFAVPPQDP